MSTAADNKVVEALRAALLENKRLQRSNQQLQEAAAEPVAIIGMACRLPGGVRDADGLWDLVAAGRDAITGFPADRGWDLDALSSATTRGGFLDDAGGFDAAFFGISPREAVAMDPQQRLLLETAWQALEHAGINPSALAGEPVGVFAGASPNGYVEIADRLGADVAGHLITGGSQSVISGRVAYALGLQGPALTVDTACSSSLVALHLAAKSLRDGECSMALVGGVAVMATADTFVGFTQQGGLAPDGRCKAFADGADGTGWSEGSGVLVVQRLSDAVREGRRVLAVVRGSAVNQDGASNGLTAPNGPAQQRVIRSALAAAGLAPSDVDAVEGHGTGTVLGDPIEAQALLAAYGQDRTEPLWLGSLKSNLGHAQAAAGVAGVIKVVQALRHGVLPATLHVDSPSAKVDWNRGAVRLLTESRPWPAVDRPRRAGISSFGVSGTNAHVILESVEPVAAPESAPETVPWVLSGHTANSVREQAAQLLDRVPGLNPVDVAWTLDNARARFDHRAVVVGATEAELVTGLRAVAAGEPAANVVTGSEPVDSGVVFVFPGQGAQWTGMALELWECSPVFATAMTECAGALSSFVDWDLRDVLGDEDSLARVDVVQPALWAVMVSLAAVWRAQGVAPDAVVGHSQGEIAAFCVAGGLSLVDGARVVALRSKAIADTLAGLGGMAAVALSAERVGKLIDDRLSVAAVNGPSSVVVSGEVAALEELVARCVADEVRARILPVDYASHSAQVERIAERLRTELAPVRPRSADLPVYSSVTGAEFDTAQADATYWVRNLRETVRFAEAAQALADNGFRAWVEISPHPVLTAAVEQTVPEAVVVGTLRRDEGGPRRMLLSLAELFAAGLPVSWQVNGRLVDLPGYAFQHERFWPDAPATGDVTGAGLAAADHPLLGAVLALPDSGGVLLTGRLSPRTQPWLADHIVRGAIVFPGTGFVELAVRAGDAVGATTLAELVLEAPLVLPERGCPVQVALTPQGADWALTVHACGAGGTWTRHATGLLTSQTPVVPAALESWPPAGANPVDLTGFYPGDGDIAYGPAFQGLTRVWRRAGEVLAEVEVPEAGAFGVHPALLDSVLHAAAFLGDDREERLPFTFTDLALHATGATRVRVRVTPDSADGVRVEVADHTGAPVLSLRSLRTRPLPDGDLLATADDTAVLVPHWTDLAEVPAATADGWVVISPADELPAEAPGHLMLAVPQHPEQTDLPATTLAVTTEILVAVQRILAEPRLDDTRLVVLTRSAVTTDETDPLVDLPAAAVWGLVRSAQAEHPDRITLVDLETYVDLDLPAIAAAVVTGEPQLAVRGTVVRVPRLATTTETGTLPPVDGTVLITGGTGGLGGLTARHLVSQHGIRSLLLVSRRGHAPELAAELTELGAEVTVAACDVSDRDDLAALLAEHPVGGVVHTAGVLDDGVLGALTAERLAGVLKPKVDATWHLHELLGDVPLFLVYSSLSGQLGSPGQANYAAGNVFADAVITHRRQLGLAGTSLAWGAWTPEIGLTGTLSEVDLRRLHGTGMPPLSVAQGLSLFDRAFGGEPVLGLTRLDLTGLRAQDDLPVVLREIVPAGVRRRVAGADRADAASFAGRWAAVPVPERAGFLRELVRGHVAAVLGHGAPEQVEVGQAFRELGFDSLTAVELRNRVAAVTGLRLPATLVFDYPNVTALAGHLAVLLGDAPAPVAAVPVLTPVAEDPIVIVGMGCRFPGEIDGPDALWRLVAEGRDTVTGFPADRGWDLAELTEVCTTDRGGFLGGVGEFDAAFFGISPREALATDPQQRLLLETSWEALEHAGIDPLSLAGSQVGVFVGAFESGYTQVAVRSVQDSAGHLVTGGSQSVISGRVAYSLGLHGPAVTVDTACSSSLVALHWAAQALRSGECSMALVGGVTVMATPDAFIGFSVQGGLAADGRCKAFADGADGTGWSEGAGVLVVQRLSDAVRDGRRVLAVLRSSAVNQDGASNGLTAPNGPAQQRVIRQALGAAGLRPSDVDVVEAHGTGTVLGDPIEAQALLATYGQDRDTPLLLGSLKSNLGHTQAAAGVAGVIKTIMALRHGVVPATLHVDAPSSRVDWADGDIVLATESTPWPESGRPRRAGVSSFGVSGTNAHVILEAPVVAEPEPTPSTGVLPWVLSGRTPEAVAAQAARLAATEHHSIADTAWTLAHRARFDHRAVVTGADQAELVAGLRALAAGLPAAQVAQGRVATGGVAVLFSGQGAQRLGMGQGLYAAYPVFAEAFDAVTAELDPRLRDVLWGEDPAALAQTGWAQPGLFAVEVALFRLLESWGVRPDYLLGHSIGEVAAAHVAGVLSLTDACALVSARARLMQALPEGGAMIAVEATEQEVAGLLSDTVSLAAVNGPDSVVLAGAETEVLAAAAKFADRRTSRLKVSHAFHSPLMEPMLAEFRQVLDGLDWQPARLPIVSNLTGEPAEVSTPDYWVRQVRETVRFADGVAWLADQGVRTLVEAGPGGTLAALAQRAAEVTAVPLLATADESRAVVSGAGALLSRGVPVDLNTLLPNGHAVDLPTYAFQRQRFWPDPAATAGDVTAAGLTAVTHPLLAAAVALPEGGLLLTGRISLATQPWLAEHLVKGAIVFPGTGFVELATRAGDAVGATALTELVFAEPLVLTERGCQLRIALTPRGTGWDLAVHARPEGAPDWTRHATGQLSTDPAPAATVDWPPTGVSVDLSDCYCPENDVAYGPAFQGLTSVWQRDDRVWAEVELPEGQTGAYGVHPALLDAVLQAVRFAGLEPAGALLPFRLGDLALHATGATRVRAQLTRTAPDTVAVAIADNTGTPVLTIGALTLRPLPAGALTAADAEVLAADWVEVPAGPAPESALLLEIPAHTGEDVVTATHTRVAETLDWLRSNVASAPLVVLTRGAVRTGAADPVTDLAAAAVWGLVRSAQAEHPGRITLVDTDADTEAALAVAGSGEPEIALRGGKVLAPRLARRTPTAEPVPVEGPVLITGGTGGLGAQLARHLVREHGVTELVLLSRRGGGADLVAELAELGASTTVVAGDVSDRDTVAALLAAHPVRGLVHAAGVVEDGLLDSLTADRLHAVLAPKVDGLWHLHELLGDVPLFAVFSSLAGTLGNAGQGNYAAANAFADSLIRWRRQHGLSGISLAWGAWTPEGGLTAGLSEVDIRRLTGSGLPPLSVPQGLALFDLALRAEDPVVGLTRLDLAALREREDLPPALAALAPAPLARPVAGRSLDGFAARWADVPVSARAEFLHELLRAHVAAVLGLTDPLAVEVEQQFRALGFDSLTAVELRNRLTAATGLTLPATLVFDYPTITELAAHLAVRLGDAPVVAPVPVAPAAVLAPVAEDPIVIVGMACRFPGGVRTPDELWDLVASGRDGISAFPADRGWDLDGLLADSVTAHGGFLDGVAEFDAAFFGISPREALAADPQQRLLLETSWEALEHAGIDPATLSGEPVGVFVGAFGSGYAELAGRASADIAGHLITGGSQSVASGRVAYSLGLQGPAMTVDTACSSSLVALHLAAQALRGAECPMALVGGVTVMASPDTFVGFTQQGGLAPDGRCKAYADSADGTGWSEGVGVLVVQRLSDAVREGREVLAVVRGSAVNQDGASNGLTAPNGPSQQRVIRQALAVAGLESSEVDAVEGHGTGTVLGDPIEAQAVLATYGQDRETPLYLGSLKSNLGHTQAAAGVAGIIKMVQAMRHGLLPATLHIDEPSSKVDWTQGAVELLAESTPWPRTDHPRRAGISSFGVSGTNAHVILEAPQPAPAEEAEIDPAAGLARGAVPWVLSARTPEAVRAQAARLLDTDLGPLNVGHTLAGRSRFAYRAVVIGADRDELRTGLRALVEGAPAALVVEGAAARRTGVGVLFSGQGAQRLLAGRRLYLRSAVFAEALLAVADELDPHLDRPLLDVLWGADAELLEHTGWAQPALFALEVALYRLLESWGVRPDHLVGHSVGEVAAAHVAGVLSLADACTLVTSRARLMQALPTGGAMIAVEATEEEVTGLLSERVSLAAVNAPGSVVLSGEEAEVLAAVANFADRRTSRLKVSHAFHSARMEPMLAEFERVLRTLDWRPAQLPIISTLTGAPADLADPGYWLRQVREPVRFAEAVAYLAEHGTRTLVEVGPGSALAASAQRCAEVEAVALLRADEDSAPVLAAARLFTAGVPVDWAALFANTGAQRVDLPAYPFTHQRFWPETHTAGDVAGAGLRSAEHPLLGAVVRLPGSGEVLLTGKLSPRTHPWLADHQVRGQIVFPGTGLVELAVRAGDAVDCDRLAELILEAPLALPERGCEVQVLLTESAAGWTFTVHSCPAGADQWTRHATGLLTTGAPTVETLADRPVGATEVDARGGYGEPADVAYGPAFQGLTRAWADGDQVWAEAELPELSAGGYGLHPALLDAVLHAAAFAGLDPADTGLLPFTLTDVVLHAAGATRVRARLTRTGGDQLAVTVADPDGAPVLTIGSLVLRPLPAGEITAEAADTVVLAPSWIPAQAGDKAGHTGDWAVIGGGEYVGMAELATAVGYGMPVPPCVVLLVPACPEPTPALVHETTAWVLAQFQRWLAEPRLGAARLVVLTRGAVEPVLDLPAAAVWGLVGSAQAENPDRITLVDLPAGTEPDLAEVARALTTGEAQIAVRGNTMLTPRLTRETATLVPPPGPWRLDTAGGGTLDALTLVPAPDLAEPVGPGQVRLAVRAAGLNFRDVLNALGMYPGDAGPLGGEAAGVVVAVGDGVTRFAPGDRVVGMVPSAFAPLADTDHRLLAPLPEGWDYPDAAALPIVFMTAYYGLVDLARVRRGEKLLVHAGTGGVGMAAIQLARQFGLEVFATASEGKWDTLRSMGLDEEHIASSRSLEFAERFRDIDVVLNSLAGEYVDASLGLLAEGGRFIEMGKTDIRDPESVAAEYRAFDLIDAGPDRIGEILAELMDLFAAGTLHPLPVTVTDLREARSVFRTMSQAKHIGKLVLTPPAPIRPDGPVLITGGTGGLGGHTARQLVTQHGIRSLLLVSRRGKEAEGALELVAELTELGADVTLAACDVSDRDALAALLADHPVGGVVHTAGVLDDGVFESLTPQRLDRVLKPKVDAAWHLHELLGDVPLFAVFSSLAGITGAPGQANYAAANTFTDALIQWRRARGLSGVSLAWGGWTPEVGLTGTLSAADLRRMNASGLPPLSVPQGLGLLDRALAAAEPVLGLTRLDPAALRRGTGLSPVLRGLTGGTPARRIAGEEQQDAFTRRWAGLTAAERGRHLLDLVRGHAAAVLGHASGADLDPGQAFKELGFDSLTAVELRNRLSGATGLRLTATLVFDYPTVADLVAHLGGQLGVAAPEPGQPGVLAELDRLGASLATAEVTGDEREAVAQRLRDLLADWTTRSTPEDDWATPEDVYRFIEDELGIAGAGE
ncbi:type I polyketide synthase [Crossiella cryophila]